jgi:hypothetical protein
MPRNSTSSNQMEPIVQPSSSQEQEKQPAPDSQPSGSQSQEQQPPQNLPDTGKAPLKKIQNPRFSHNPGRYFVYLHPDHTLAQHSAAVGRDMQPYVQALLDFLYKDRVVYIGGNIDGELLDLIRMDSGVEFVREECLGRWD